MDSLVYDLLWPPIILVESEKTLNISKTWAQCRKHIKNRVNILTSFISVSQAFKFLTNWKQTVTHTRRAVCWSKRMCTLLYRGDTPMICFAAERKMIRVSGWTSKVNELVYGISSFWQVWIKVHHKDPSCTLPLLPLNILTSPSLLHIWFSHQIVP